MKSIVEAELAWRYAWDANEHFGTAQTYKAEQDAWYAYTDLCNEIDQCQEPGCRETVPEYCYCPRHRPS